MRSRPAIERRFRLFRFTLFIIWTGLAAIIIAWSVRSAAERAEFDARQKAGETLAVQAGTLTGVLDKYRLMPPLLARQSSVAALFVRDADGNPRSLEARRTADEIAGMSSALDVAFLFPDGEILAHAGGPFVEAGIGLAALIETARQGRLGRAALSLGSQRTYAFSSGVRRFGALIGVVIVYVDFSRVENAWALSTQPIFVTDQSGQIFLSNRPEWLLENVRTIPELNDTSTSYDLVRNLPLLDWELHVLADARPVAIARLTAAVIATLVCLLAGLVALILLRRNELALVRERRDRAIALRLERVVRDRTRALSLSNETLSHEVEVRREAEERLRRTQAELVQAAKLAALGQMSAALSHEFNQPLAAIRNYADNGLRFLERGRPDDAAGNLTRINGLVERMAELSRTLLSFARKPGTTTGPVPLETVIEEALILARPRARAAGVSIQVDDSVKGISVAGGRVRLGQVFVNLINNAVDAIAATGKANGLIAITSARFEGRILVCVSDNGPGIEPDEIAHVFDPFFTTKPAGEGIGIGLSIVDNILRDFGGTIRVETRPQGGAAFTIDLAEAEPAA